MDMEKVYEPQKFESDIYAQWLEKGYFTPEINRDKKPFTIVIPPPNITGQLHMGHALDNAVRTALFVTRECGLLRAVAARHRPCVHCNRA